MHRHTLYDIKRFLTVASTISYDYYNMKQWQVCLTEIGMNIELSVGSNTNYYLVLKKSVVKFVVMLF
jgi:hypothetical protein